MRDIEPIYYDTETCGFHGPIVLIQYAFGDGEVFLYSPWKKPIQETIDLIEEFMAHEGGTIGFNLAFDQFHLCQMYTTLLLMKDKRKLLQDCVLEYALAEPEARDGVCLKPQKCMDLMLHARKGPYQSTMDRSDIRIRRIPTPLAWDLANELGRLIPLKDIYFARRKDKRVRWQVMDIQDDMGDIIPDFKDIVLKFAPSSALKALAVDAGIADEKTRLLMEDVNLPKASRPVELGYAPFALAIGTPDDWKGAWPAVIHQHYNHWSFNPLARRYAEDDVHDTRGLDKFFKYPEMDDDDSVLSCMVASVRWRGFKIDEDGLRLKKQEAQHKIDSAIANFLSPNVCKKYLREVMDDAELLTMTDGQGKITTKGIILEEIAKWKEEEVCDECLGLSDCEACEEGLIETGNPHPAATRAQEILDTRHAKKEMENYDKLLLAGRFHASFKVIGTLSSRMSGGDGLNAQGIKRDKSVRRCFPLAFSGMQLDGGDFAGFEVCLADAVYGDMKLREDLLSGKKIHALFGQHLFPGKSYDDIIETSGLPGEKDIYSRSKQGVFALLYGGEGYTLSTRVGVPEATANEAYHQFTREYVTLGEERKKYNEMFCSMRQPGGIGSKVEWHDPADYVESMLGFKRYFTLENRIAKSLFSLAEDPPKPWKQLKMKVVRRDREQTACGALRSALFGAAFQIQGAVSRAAANHVIQSTGAVLTKNLQRRIWDLQPCGIGHWYVQPLNVHDEIMCPCQPTYSPKITQIVEAFIEEIRPKVPLIEIDWGQNLSSWADK